MVTSLVCCLFIAFCGLLHVFLACPAEALGPKPRHRTPAHSPLLIPLQVLHPQAMQPAIRSGKLNVRVKNSYNRSASGALAHKTLRQGARCRAEGL